MESTGQTVGVAQRQIVAVVDCWASMKTGPTQPLAASYHQGAYYSQSYCLAAAQRTPQIAAAVDVAMGPC